MAKLKIQIEGDPKTHDELRVAATGMQGSGWEYSWRVVDLEGNEVSNLRSQGADHHVVHWRAPSKPGVYTVEVFASRHRERHVSDVLLALNAHITAVPGRHGSAVIEL